ncbi:MAG: methylglyoxal synthase [Promethearchaeota archaeon]
MSEIKKTFIGVLASHDDIEINRTLVKLLDHLVENGGDSLKNFAFIFTGGTFDRVILGAPDIETTIYVDPVSPETRKVLLDQCGVLRLPPGKDGGVIILTYLVINRIVSLIWSFITPKTTHLLKPDNLSLMRLSDLWSVKRLMNAGSILEWYWKESQNDIKFNSQNFPPSLELKRGQIIDPRKVQSITWSNQKIIIEYDARLNIPPREIEIKKQPSKTNEINPFGPKLYYELEPPEIHRKFDKKKLPTKDSENPKTIALIAHDNMKDRMVEFATHYEKELSNFIYILTTGTTGKIIQEAAPRIQRVERCHTGTKGGDIEIATEILYDKCESIIFFIDALNPHPHIDDIRVVFFACAIKDNVRMFSNETHAKEWFETVIRGRIYP